MLIEDADIVHVVITGAARGEEFAVVDTGTERRPFDLIATKDTAGTVLRRIVT